MTGLSLDILCRQLPACIISRDHQQLKLAVATQPSAEITEALCFASQCQVEYEIWPLTRIENQLRNQPRRLHQEVPEYEIPGVPQVASQLLQLAVRQRASDIHLEQTLQGTVIRLRIDGLLQPATLPGSFTAPALIARFKILAGLDIAESRLLRTASYHWKLTEKITVFVYRLCLPGLEKNWCSGGCSYFPPP